MRPSNSKNSITSTRWRDFASSKSNLMRKLPEMRDKTEKKKKRLSNYREFNPFLMKFSLKFLRRASTRKPETR